MATEIQRLRAFGRKQQIHDWMYALSLDGGDVHAALEALSAADLRLLMSYHCIYRGRGYKNTMAAELELVYLAYRSNPYEAQEARVPAAKKAAVSLAPTPNEDERAKTVQRLDPRNKCSKCDTQLVGAFEPVICYSCRQKALETREDSRDS